ncbi:MATE family efflux transporter [Oscillibacter sp. MSJ-2]|uniref:Probable multidrug resistance protein NorM n=1 Tax=Dysosmobacter acutus TaxID=2841504 RepID=A0ABS6F753_9FIRM|nr:MATE family efflux transporter [Dysosmobacter acutus]MBU5626118.1 MATE family efflux transporter [Dysosmobacter acutus]
MYSKQDLKHLLIPLVIEQTLVVLVGMVDTVVVSTAGEAAVSGVALVDMVNYLIITVMAALTTGGSVICAQYFGSGQRDRAAFSAGQLMAASAIFSTAIMFLCLTLRTAILHLFFGVVEPDVVSAARAYFLVTACSFPFLGIYDAASALYRVMGRTTVTMYVSLLMNAVNIVGDLLGVYIWKAGVLGVAVPTLVSRAMAALVMTSLAFRPGKEISLCWSSILSWDRDTVGRILSIAVPSGVENGLFALGKVLVVSIVSHFGTVQIAANGVANSISQIAVMVVGAVNIAVISVVGRCMGAGEHEQAEQYTRQLMKVSYISLAVLGTLVCALLPVILPLYQLEPETLRLAAVLIVLHNVLALLLHPTSFNLPNSLRAAGDARFTMEVGVCSMVVFRLGSAMLLGVALHLGVLGVWLAMGLDWLARSVAFALRYRSKTWATIQTI